MDADLRVKRVWWPYVAVAGACAVGVLGFVLYGKHARAKEAYEARYPIVATSAQLDVLEKYAPRWSKGRDKLLTSVASLPAIESIKAGAACKLSFAIPAIADLAPAPPDGIGFRRVDDEDDLREAAGDGNAARGEDVLVFESASADLGERTAAHVDALLASADRQRFHSDAGADHVLRAISLPYIVVQLTSDVPPRTMKQDDRDVFRPGHRAGVAYIFDPESGALRCAGHFEATSSDQVRTLEGMTGLGNGDAALAKDLDDNTFAAFKTSLTEL